MNRSRPRTFPRPLKAPHASSGPSLPPERQPLLYVLLLFMPILELQGNSCVQLFHWPNEVTHAVLTSLLLCIPGQWESLNLLTTLLLIGIGCFQL